MNHDPTSASESAMPSSDMHNDIGHHSHVIMQDVSPANQCQTVMRCEEINRVIQADGSIKTKVILVHADEAAHNGADLRSPADLQKGAQVVFVVDDPAGDMFVVGHEYTLNIAG